MSNHADAAALEILDFFDRLRLLRFCGRFVVNCFCRPRCPRSGRRHDDGDEVRAQFGDRLTPLRVSDVAPDNGKVRLIGVDGVSRRRRAFLDDRNEPDTDAIADKVLGKRLNEARILACRRPHGKAQAYWWQRKVIIKRSAHQPDEQEDAERNNKPGLSY